MNESIHLWSQAIASDLDIRSLQGWRVRSAKQVLRGFKPRDVGVTRLSFVNNFDHIGVYVAQAARPQVSVHQITSTQGCSTTIVGALCGAVMEAAERSALAHPEIACRATVRQARELWSVLYAPCLDADTEPVSWAQCTEITTGVHGLVPASMIYFPLDDSFLATRPHTSGAAAGSTVLEATLYATAEVVERFYLSLLLRGRIRPRALAGRLPPPTQGIVDQLALKGYRVKFLSLGPGPMPVIVGLLQDTSGLTRGGVYHTSAAHPDAAHACNSVALGLAQIIATVMQSSREDLRRTAAVHEGDGTENYRLWDSVESIVDSVDLRSLSCDITGQTMADLASSAVANVCAYFDTKVYWKDLTRLPGVCVVRTAFEDLVDGVVEPDRFDRAMRNFE